MFTNRPALNNRSTEALTDEFPMTAKTATRVEGPSADVYYIRDSVQRKLLAETEGEVDLSHIPQMR
ncbi:MAG: hypothetical protein V3S81_01440, partial [Anaerolineales bacterium]